MWDLLLPTVLTEEKNPPAHILMLFQHNGNSSFGLCPLYQGYHPALFSCSATAVYNLVRSQVRWHHGHRQDRAHTAPHVSTVLQPHMPVVARHLMHSSLLQLSGIALQDTADQTLEAHLLHKNLLLIHSPFIAFLHYSQLCLPPVVSANRTHLGKTANSHILSPQLYYRRVKLLVSYQS